MIKVYIDFQKISQEVLFQDLLDFLNIPYTEKNGYLKTRDIIVSKKKNLFMYKGGKKGGGVVNFVADVMSSSLRDAAKFLLNNFLTEKEPKREIPELELIYTQKVEEMGISEELAKEFEVGLVKQKSVMAGKIAFKLYDHEGNKIGYIGKEVKKDGWFYPKGFKRNIVYNLNRCNTDYAILTVSPLDVLHLHSLGFPFSVALLGKSATTEQIDLLKRFRRILIFHPEPDNITLRLSEYCFIKAVTINSVRELDSEKIKSYF